VIVTGTIVASRSSLYLIEVDLRVTRTLKGKPQPSVTFVYDAFGDKRTLLSTLAAIFLCSMALRSRYFYDDVVFATPLGQHEVSFVGGRLQYLLVNDEPQSHDAIYRSTPLRDPRTVPDHIQYLYPAKTSSYLGVERVTGVTPPAEASARFSYQLTRVRFSTLLIAALLLPGARLGAFAIRRLTARSRRRRKLCPSCGYDLRSSRDRCPECGRPAKMP